MAPEGSPGGARDGGGGAQPIAPRTCARLLGRWAGSGGRPLAGTGSPRRRGAAELRVEHGGGAEVGAGRGATDRENSDHATAPARSLQQKKQ